MSVGRGDVLWDSPLAPGLADYHEYRLGTGMPAPIAVDTVEADLPDVYHVFRRVVTQGTSVPAQAGRRHWWR